MKYLFWNTHNNYATLDILVRIILNYGCDFISLAEFEFEINELLEKLNKLSPIRYYDMSLEGASIKDRIKTISVFNPLEIVFNKSYGQYKISVLKLESDLQLIISVHLPSKLYDSDGCKGKSLQLKTDVEEIESKYNTNNTIIMGDFNMNPFEEGMVSSIYLHALSSKSAVAKGKRTISGKESKMFFNPMWSFMGEYSKSIGSYYYSASHYKCYFWNTFDQILIRPEIVDRLNENSIEIIKSVDEIDLCQVDGKPDSRQYSDHLPLYFEIYNKGETYG